MRWRLAEQPGYFYPPTVLVRVPQGARVLDEEIFGPVAPVQTFREDDDVVVRPNQTDYGWSRICVPAIERALRAAERIETGILGLNQGIVSNTAAPFGGVKHSGFGREGIEEYLSMKYLAVTAMTAD